MGGGPGFSLNKKIIQDILLGVGVGVEVHPTILSMSYSTQPSGVKTHPPDMSNFDKSTQTFLQANKLELFKV